MEYKVSKDDTHSSLCGEVVGKPCVNVFKDISLVLQVWKISETKYSGFGDGEWWVMLS